MRVHDEVSAIELAGDRVDRGQLSLLLDQIGTTADGFAKAVA
jgi:hypothetical protein